MATICTDCGNLAEIIPDGFESETDGRKDTPDSYETACCGADWDDVSEDNLNHHKGR